MILELTTMKRIKIGENSEQNIPAGEYFVLDAKEKKDMRKIIITYKMNDAKTIDYKTIVNIISDYFNANSVDIDTSQTSAIIVRTTINKSLKQIHLDLAKDTKELPITDLLIGILTDYVK